MSPSHSPILPRQAAATTSLVLPGGGTMERSARSSESSASARQNIVIIRHGKTEHNKLGLFTGWEDAPLAPEGVREAARAGELLAAHGIAFDVVYASWLSRSIRTAWIVLDR